MSTHDMQTWPVAVGGLEPAASEWGTHPATVTSLWSYNEAFCRNRGLISPQEQEILRHKKVAIVGMGGVGGIHLVTLVRLGIGKFTICDPESFELANFNRQYGASLRSIGKPKAQVMAEEALSINPALEITVIQGPVTAQNVAAVLRDADLFVDAIDFFAIEERRLLFREARTKNIWAVTAGPIGFSVAWLLFDPKGMSFDRYFDLHDQMDRLDQLAAFAVGLAPRATHLKYLNLEEVNVSTATAPSAGLACALAAGVVAAESVKLLLGRREVRAAPWFFQFDPYRHAFVRGRLLFANRGPWQRLKRWWLRRKFSPCLQ